MHDARVACDLHETPVRQSVPQAVAVRPVRPACTKRPGVSSVRVRAKGMDMTNEIATVLGAGEDGLAWDTAWQSLSVGLNQAREITSLISRGQTTSVQSQLLSLAECEFFRVASGVTEEHPHVLRGRAALLERHPECVAAFEEVWQKADGLAANGHLLHALIAGVLVEMAEEFGFRPDSPDTDLRIRQESVWCWYELVIAGLKGRASVGSAAYRPNRGIYQNEDTYKSRKDWALRRTRAGLKGSQGEQLAARDIVRRIGSSIEPVPVQIGQVDSLSILDQMLPPSLAAATRRRLARHTGTPQLTTYQAETIPVLAKAMGSGENLLLSAVTGSGKSLLGQLAAGYVVGRRELGHRNRRAVIALPLKALVGDVVNELTGWFADAGLQFRVLGGSRDYPENVEDLASGRYEVAVMIYETLDAYLSSGQDPLRGCGVLIVDELQYLDDEGRGPRLESMLTKVRLNYPTLPIVGISAVLSQESRTRLAGWLDVDQERHRHTSARPVSLDVRAYDGFMWRKLRDTSAVSDDGDDAGSGAIEEAELDLKSQMLSDWARDDGASRSILARARSGGNVLAPAVVVHKLKENPDLRLLVYTRSRSSAFSLAAAIQAAMDREFGAIRRTRNNPWRFGRYRDESLTVELAEERRQRLSRTAAHGARKDVETALMTGCAYHTRQLTRPLRELVQDEFRNGLLRVLVTTDTLSVGLNLPVDVVVLASCTVSTGGATGELRSLGLGDVKNRIGRAGRLGLSKSGDAWMLTEDAEYLHRKLRRNDDMDATTLSTVDGLWQQFVLPRHGGTEVASRMSSDDMALLVLQDMTAQGRSQPLTEHIARAHEVIGATLLANLVPEDLPRAEDVLQGLIKRGLVAELDVHGWKASPLGVAIAVNNLPLATAPVLEQLADLAVHGASELDLIAVAATSLSVRRLNWISMSAWEPDWTHGELEQETIKSVGRLIAPMCAEGRDARLTAEEELLRELRQRDPNAVLSPLPESVLTDQRHGDDSAVVGLLRTSDGLRDVNVVLRAFVAYLWRHGVPFADIKGRVEAGTRYERERRSRRGRRRVTKELRRVELHLADVEQLCDQVSNVLGAADHFARHRSTGPRTQRLRPLSDAIWSGVPPWLTPLLDLHVEALHRERLITLPGDEEPEELRDLLTTARLGLTEAEVEAARAALDAAERRQQPLQARLPVGLGEKPVADDPDAPSYGDYFTDFSLAEDLPEVIDLLTGLLERYHLRVQAMADRVQFRLPSGQTGTLLIATERVTGAVVKQTLVDEGAGEEARALLCLNGMTDRARSHAQSMLAPGRVVLTGIDSLLSLLNRSLRAGQDSGTPTAEAVFASFAAECGRVSVVLTSA
ncbi:DEAD/DEAH box helicase [Micromonospora sp. NPDC048935]|uniref:DEAD/DEAH box helicase n=1 Tax=Micromonospora sp. NPDC048935 TaxID=3364262 RepID=UPI0037179DF4